MNKKKIVDQPMKIEMLGYEAVEKVAMPSGNSSRIYLPVQWEGTRIRAVRTESKQRIRTEFFERYFASMDHIYNINTILKPEETLNKLSGLLTNGGLLG